jgi:hypothetical protein
MQPTSRLGTQRDQIVVAVDHSRVDPVNGGQSTGTT